MLNRELEVATAAAQEAGRAIVAIMERGDVQVRLKEGDRGPLTEADLASEAILLEALRSAFPEDGLLSEETADTPERLGRPRVWILDPLDGTREFTLGLPEFVVSVGLAVQGEPALGVVFNPLSQELFTGVLGQGATYAGGVARVSGHATVEGARFLVSRNEMEKGWFDAWKGRAQLQPLGSVAYKLALVAAGRADATFTPKPRNEWDLCGGVACLLAAGGQASDGAGVPYRFNRPDPLKQGVCGTNGALHAQVLKLMQER